MRTPSSPAVVVIGGGLAGITAALDLAAGGAEVTLLERRSFLGGLTSSVERRGLSFDNGQHVFLRCCRAYTRFLERIGASGSVALQARMDVPVVRPGGRTARLSRSWLPAPFHLLGSLATYGHLSARERLRLGPAALALRRLDPGDGALDDVSFGQWLRQHGQSRRAIEQLWNLIALPTLNLPADGASLALAVKVFRLGLLDRNDGGDIGWSKVPLAELHGSRSLAALHAAGVAVELGVPVRHLGRGRGGHFEVGSPARSWLADGVVLAVPPPAATGLLAPLLPAGGAAADGPFSQAAARRLGASPIVNIHLVLDRRVTDLPMAAGVDSPVQFVFDRTGPSGLVRGQCLGISLSGAYEYVSIPSDELVPAFLGALGELFPPARKARLVDAVVTRERFATFRAAPGSRRDRPPETTPVAGAFLAGAWCDTGWPATMEGAVRSGASAAAAAHRFFASISPAEAFDPRLEEAHS